MSDSTRTSGDAPSTPLSAGSVAGSGAGSWLRGLVGRSFVERPTERLTVRPRLRARFESDGLPAGNDSAAHDSSGLESGGMGVDGALSIQSEDSLDASLASPSTSERSEDSTFGPVAAAKMNVELSVPVRRILSEPLPDMRTARPAAHAAATLLDADGRLRLSATHIGRSMDAGAQGLMPSDLQRGLHGAPALADRFPSSAAESNAEGDVAGGDDERSTSGDRTEGDTAERQSADVSDALKPAAGLLSASTSAVSRAARSARLLSENPAALAPATVVERNIVRVKIGRIEVQTPPPPARPPAAPRPGKKSSSISIEDYLRDRREGRR